jgi:hypothetical protein
MIDLTKEEIEVCYRFVDEYFNSLLQEKRNYFQDEPLPENYRFEFWKNLNNKLKRSLAE